MIDIELWTFRTVPIGAAAFYLLLRQECWVT